MELKFIELRPAEGREHPALPGSIMGRSDCEIVLSDPEVSRRHAAVRGFDDELAIEDLGSRNGTFVNGERVSGIRRLAAGDEVRLGETVLCLSAAPDPTRVSSSPARRSGAYATPEAERAQRPEAPPPAATPAAAEERRGDVPAPDSMPPSAIRPLLPPTDGQRHFTPVTGRAVRRSAARRVEATVVAYAVVLATAVAVVLYFVQR